MSIKRRVVVEVIGNVGSHHTVDYERNTPCSLHVAIEEVIDLSFAPIEGESNYAGWSRCIINVSGPLCTYDDCTNDIEHADEQATQVCWQCQEKEDRAIADATTYLPCKGGEE